MRVSALALTALAALVRADLELDAEDVPAPCAVICKPVRELSSICDVDDSRVPDDHTQSLLEAQCICTNDSFDVGKITALCASCIKENAKTDDDKDGLEDVGSIMSTCGFASTSFASSQATLGETITVNATRPTASSQLTTTITGGSSAPSTTGSGASGATASATTSQSKNAGPTQAPRVAEYVAGLLAVGAAAVL
ncbi:hypothetical protein VTK73DRAFT_9168 [Phialemonium thermophilum]|uniref:Protein CAP22 n=1 Tax=Phialemonium thermophilum TaxID=223376 RepID=A0ABR3W423_9PEZI